MKTLFTLLFCSITLVGNTFHKPPHVDYGQTDVAPIQPVEVNSAGMAFFLADNFIYTNTVENGSYVLSGDVRDPCDPQELGHPLLNQWVHVFPQNALILDCHGGGGPDPEDFVIMPDYSVLDRYPDIHKGVMTFTTIHALAEQIGDGTNTITVAVMGVCNHDKGLTPALVQKYFPHVQIVLQVPQGTYGETSTIALQANPNDMALRLRVRDCLIQDAMMLIATSNRYDKDMVDYAINALLKTSEQVESPTFPQDAVAAIRIEAILMKDDIQPLHKYILISGSWIDSGIYWNN